MRIEGGLVEVRIGGGLVEARIEGGLVEVRLGQIFAPIASGKQVRRGRVLSLGAAVYSFA